MPVSRTHSLLCLLVSSIPVVADQLLGLLSYRFFHLKQTPAINLSMARAVHESACERHRSALAETCLQLRICRTDRGFPGGRLIRVGNDGRDRHCSGEREGDG